MHPSQELVTLASLFEKLHCYHTFLKQFWIHQRDINRTHFVTREKFQQNWCNSYENQKLDLQNVILAPPEFKEWMRKYFFDYRMWI